MCGERVKENDVNKIGCQKCEPGKTYSDDSGFGSCKSCQICSAHQTIVRTCTLEANSKCNKTCSRGYYFEKTTGDCQQCSWCCSDGTNSVKDECKDMPPNERCDANTGSDCKPKCKENQYIRNGSCKACSECSVGQKELRPCNVTNDRICGECDKGFYKDDNHSECKPCSACCDDDEDVHVQKCAQQNMPENLQCSYTQRAISVCQQKRNTNIVHQESKSSLVVYIASGVAVGLVTLALAMLYLRLKYRKYKSLSSHHSQVWLLQPSEEEGRFNR